MTRAPAPADEVNRPSHYTAGPPCPHCGEVIECITITEGRDFLTGNALKYLWRAGLKGVALTDLLKARWYVDRAIQVEQARSAPERAATASDAPLDDDSLSRQIGELGNQIHNLGCEHQDDEKLSDRLAELRETAWKLARRAAASPATAQQAASAAPTTRQPVPGVYGAEITDCDDAPVSAITYRRTPA